MIEKIEKVKLGNYPTPIEKLDNITKLLGGGKVYIKRDDLTGPAMGGNKTRKLEYLIKDAIDKGCTTILTEGGPQTNHGRITVGAANKVGLKSAIVLYSKEKDKLTGNLVLDALMGTDIHFLENEVDKKVAIEQIISEYESKGEKVYHIPLGGSNELGALGYMMAAKEIHEELMGKGLVVENIVCTIGSMGTYVGLLLGNKYWGYNRKIIGVPVIPRVISVESVLNYANLVIDKFNLQIEVEESDVLINFGPEQLPYCGEEYNKPDHLTRAAIITMAKAEGIILDPTYTGKTFRGLMDMIKSGDWISSSENTLFLHTGGMVGIWSGEHLEDMQGQLKRNCIINSVKV